MAYAQRTVDNAPDKVCSPAAARVGLCKQLTADTCCQSPFRPVTIALVLQAASLTNCIYLAPDDPLARAQFLELGAL